MEESDTLDFNQRCDGSLPLETMLKPDPTVRKLLQDIDRSKTRVWGLTNAYVTVSSLVLDRNQADYMSEGYSMHAECCKFLISKIKWRA